MPFIYAVLAAAIVLAVVMDKGGVMPEDNPNKGLPSGSGQGARHWSVEEFKTAFFAAWEHVANAGIPAGLAYAVSSLETGHGNGKVFQNSNNLFSILATPSWKGPVYQGRPNSLTANPKGDSHRVYPTWEAAMADWVRLMQTPHYAAAYEIAVNSGNPTEFFRALQSAGYAGINQVYADSLTRVYNNEVV